MVEHDIRQFQTPGEIPDHQILNLSLPHTHTLPTSTEFKTGIPNSLVFADAMRRTLKTSSRTENLSGNSSSVIYFTGYCT